MKTLNITYRGTFRGGDPRKFLPDTDACTPEQLENHRAFCNIWNAAEAAGEAIEPEPEQFDRPENSRFGVGFQGSFDYEIEDSDAGLLFEQMRSINR